MEGNKDLFVLQFSAFYFKLQTQFGTWMTKRAEFKKEKFKIAPTHNETNTEAVCACCGSWLAGVKAGHEKPQQCHSSLSRKSRTAR